MAISVCLVPDEGVGQVGRSLERLLEEVPFHGNHQVNPDEVQGHRGLGHGDLQQRLVPCRSGAEVTELHVGTGELDLLMKNLEGKCMVDLLRQTRPGRQAVCKPALP